MLSSFVKVECEFTVKQLWKLFPLWNKNLKKRIEIFILQFRICFLPCLVYFAQFRYFIATEVWTL